MGGALGGLFIFFFVCFLIFLFGVIGLVDKARTKREAEAKKAQGQDDLKTLMEALELAGMFDTANPQKHVIIENDYLSEIISQFIARDERLFWVGVKRGMQVVSGQTGQKYGWYLTTGHHSIGFDWRRK